MDEDFQEESDQWVAGRRDKKVRYSRDLLILSPDKMEKSTGVPLAVCSTLKRKAEGEFEQWQASKRHGACPSLSLALP